MSDFITMSISFFDEDSYKKIVSALTDCNVETKFGLHDISMLDEYLNIIADSSEQAADELAAMFINNFPDIYWRCMKSDGETILSIKTYDENGESIEVINKTMDELAGNDEYACSGNCSGCDKDCHGDSCGCSECNSFNMQSTIDMMNDMSKDESAEEYFDTLVCAYHEELHCYTSEQFSNEDECEEAMDIFLNTMAMLMISTASCDGIYTDIEHKYLSHVLNVADIEKIKAIIANTDVMSDEAINERMKLLELWHDAERCEKSEMRKLFLTICTFLCACDNDVNEVERAFLHRLSEI